MSTNKIFMEDFNKIKYQPEKTEEESTPIQEILQEAELIKIETGDRNKEGLLLVADGRISHYQNELHWKMLKTEAFRKWFAGSVVTHKDNQEPVMVFHSTLKREFVGQNLKLNERVDDWNSFGVYFSSNKKATIDFYTTQYKDDVARFERLLISEPEERENILADKNRYLEENQGTTKTFAAFIKIEQALELSDHEKLMELSWAGFNRQDLLNEHDGIIINHDSEFYDQYIVFKPENILIIPSELDQSR